MVLYLSISRNRGLLIQAVLHDLEQEEHVTRHEMERLFVELAFWRYVFDLLWHK